MKRYVLPLLIVLLPVAIYALWEWTPRTVPPERASELYRQYASNPHLTVSYIEDFRVNDTVTVDVTLLEAKDDEGWEEMQKRFNIIPLPQEVVDILGEKAETGVEVWLAPRNNYHLPMDDILLNNDVLSVSHKKKQLCIFETVNEKQIDAISKHQFEEGHTDIHHNN